jgi:hypothetical protein
MWRSMSGVDVVGDVALGDVRGAVAVPEGAFRAAPVATGTGGAVRDETDLDEVVVEELAWRDGCAAVVVVGAGPGGTVRVVREVVALAGPSAPSDGDLSGRMKAKDSKAVRPPIHSRTRDGNGFQLASGPTASRCVRNSRR